jgi:hypothetical protein
MEAIHYKGWTIEENPNGCFVGELMAYPTEQGIQHDADFDGDRYRYCGNCLFDICIDNLKDSIDENIMMAKPLYLVETKALCGPIITKFEWISDAMAFAARFNGITLFDVD